MARAATLVTAALTLFALGACGGDDGGGGSGASEASTAERSEPRQVVADYLGGFRRKDYAAVCETLAPRGRGVLASLLPSGSRSSCEDVAARVARNSVALKRVKISRAKVSGANATVQIRSTDPPFESGVLLAKGEDGWRIAYPPGLITKLKTPPGVPEHKDEPGHKD
jgi:hypothetical protein